MKNYRIRRLAMVLAVTGFLGAAIGIFGGKMFRSAEAEPAPATPAAKPTADSSKPTLHDWPMFGGTPARNFVNEVDTGIPITWSGVTGKEKNIKWSAQLGSKPYGGPII